MTTTQSSDQVARAAAEEICGYFGDTQLAMQGHVNANGIAAIISRHLRTAAVPVGEPHRCPHFQPKGEDSGGAYNAGIINDMENDLLDTWTKERLSAKPTSWYSLLIKQLIQRIANLRVMLAAENAAPAPVAPAVTEDDK